MKKEQNTKEQSIDRLSTAFKALSNPNRVAIFEEISFSHGKILSEKESPSCCYSKDSKIKISQPTVSHHLKELRLAGLINCERDGQNIN